MRTKPAKKRPSRSLHRRGLVVTEGTATETQYVERLQQHLRQASVSVSVKTVGVGKDPREVVKKCIKLKQDAIRRQKEYDWYVCLTDRDKHTTHAAAISLASKNGISLLVTNLKFEMWLLWHVADIRSRQSSSSLDHLMVRHNLLKGKDIPLRFPIQEFSNAVRIARSIDPGMESGRIGPDPSSALPILVQMMRGEH